MTYEQWKEKNKTHDIEDRFLKYAQNGIHGKDWYLNSKKIISERFKNADLFIDILSATSPRNQVKTNLDFAIKAYRIITNNYKITKKHKFGLAGNSIRENLKRIQENVPISGQKIQAFSEALKGNEKSIVIDTWMMKASGLKRVVPTPNDIIYISEAIMKVADRIGMSYSSTQACIWCGIKASVKTNHKQDYDFSYYLNQLEIFEEKA